MSSSRLAPLFTSLACVFFFASFASGASIAPNHVKDFKGEAHVSKLLIVHLTAPERTNLLIEVTKGDRIVEYHRLVVGPEGVCEGRFKGVHSWNYVLPAWYSVDSCAVPLLYFRFHVVRVYRNRRLHGSVARTDLSRPMGFR